MIDVKNKIEEIGKYLDYVIEFTDYNSGYIGDNISEIADNCCSVYYSDAFDWLKEGGNASYVDDAIAELGAPETDDNFMYHCITQGQYVKAEQEIYEDIDDYIMIVALEAVSEKTDEITEEQFEELENELGAIDNNNEVSDIYDIVKTVLEGDEDDEEE